MGGAERARLRICRADLRLPRLRRDLLARLGRRDRGGSLRDRPPVLRARLRHEDLFPEDRGSRRHRTHRGCGLHDQSHRGGVPARDSGLSLDRLAGVGLRAGGGYGGGVAGAGDDDPATPRAGTRDSILAGDSRAGGVAKGPGRPISGRRQELEMFLFAKKKMQMVAPGDSLPGRDRPIPTAETHFVTGRPLSGEVPEGMEQAMFGMGCFWGVERMFWKLPGVWMTRVGYAGGYTPNPTYQEVCTGRTGHNEVVHVIYVPKTLSYEDLLKIFWEGHDPTQGMRQGNDVCTQYRSGIYSYSDAQRQAAEASRDAYASQLARAGYGEITTEIVPAPEFFAAEDYHQQYLAKNPAGYCGIGGTGVSCPVGLGVA